MMRKLLQRLQSAYEPILVLLIIGVAGLLMYALYRATGGGGSGYSVVVTFDDVDGLKERSKVLFNGMPVGTVRQMAYDKGTNRILVRLDIDQSAEIPTNVKAFLESSLFGEAHIALKTKEKPTEQLLASKAVEESRDLTKLYRIEGEALSKAESVMPGFNKAMIEVTDAAEVAKDKVAEFSDEVTQRLRGPVQKSLDAIEEIIKGPEGQEDQALTAKLQRAAADIRRHSDAIDELFHGNGQNAGLLTTVNRAGQNWEAIVGQVTDGKSKALDEIDQMSKSLKNATDAIAASKADMKKLGSASDKLGAASDSVNQFVDVVKSRPNSLVWGLNRDQKAKLNESPPRPPTTGAGKR